jgi:hypothetical protein
MHAPFAEVKIKLALAAQISRKVLWNTYGARGIQSIKKLDSALYLEEK